MSPPALGYRVASIPAGAAPSRTRSGSNWHRTFAACHGIVYPAGGRVESLPPGFGCDNASQEQIGVSYALRRCLRTGNSAASILMQGEGPLFGGPENGMRLILAGGGDATRSAKVDSFYRSLNPGRRTIACIPQAIAPAEGAWERAERWLLERPALKGFDAHTIGDLAGVEPATLRSFHSMFIMGGNTFTLLAGVKAVGFGSKLKAVLDEVPIYGTSAGAIILGHDMSSPRSVQSPTRTRRASLIWAPSISSAGTTHTRTSRRSSRDCSRTSASGQTAPA